MALAHETAKSGRGQGDWWQFPSKDKMERGREKFRLNCVETSGGGMAAILETDDLGRGEHTPEQSPENAVLWARYGDRLYQRNACFADRAVQKINDECHDL